MLPVRVPELARQWQERLDSDFPQGALVMSPDVSKMAFTIPRPVVVFPRGLEPEDRRESPQRSAEGSVYDGARWFGEESQESVRLADGVSDYAIAQIDDLSARELDRLGGLGA